jgi:hypothetical protein
MIRKPISLPCSIFIRPQSIINTIFILGEANKGAEKDMVGHSYSCGCDKGFKINTENTSLCIPLDAIVGIPAGLGILFN